MAKPPPFLPLRAAEPNSLQLFFATNQRRSRKRGGTSPSVASDPIAAPLTVVAVASPEQRAQAPPLSPPCKSQSPGVASPLLPRLLAGLHHLSSATPRQGKWTQSHGCFSNV